MKINSDLVKKLRSEKHWSQEQLSEVCGLNLRTIQRLENTGKASIESVRALAAVFKVDPNDLILIEKDGSISAVDAIKTGFIKFANFSGTATRFEYWWFFIFVLLVSAMATIFHEKANQIVSLIILLPFIAVGTRRLNDIGRSAWWQLLFLVPFGAFFVFYLCAQESKVNTSQPGTESLDAA